MNTARIARAIADIDTNTEALKWLQEYGPSLTGRDRDEASVNVRIAFAAACPGAKQAAEVLSSFATLSLPDLVQTAIKNCENTIEMARSAIREEVQ